MDLRGYEHAKFALAELLRQTSTLNEAMRYDSVDDEIRDLFARLAEDRFNLVVAGRFNRGKSSLMNAIMGVDRLPTGILPLTSVVTTVSYGSESKVVLKYRERRLDSTIRLEDLPSYITQQGNPGNEKGIATANLEIPAEILRRGYHFIDTPGLGSAIIENTATTEAFLPEADALLLVTSYESPLSEEEARIVEASFRSALHLFVVINKQDVASVDERRQTTEFLARQLRELYRGASPRLFSVSALTGLEAKKTGDLERLAESGLPALEEALADFLLEHRRKEFLLHMARRIASLIREMPRSAESAELLRQADALEGRFGLTQRREAVSDDDVQRRTDFYRVRPCEICEEVADAVWDFLRRYQYDLSIDNNHQKDFAKRSGFCAFHTWEYQAIASAYGICTGYPSLLDRLARELRGGGACDQRERPDAASLLPAEQECALCEIRDDAEDDAVRRLADSIRANGTRSLNSLSALCLPHVSMLTSMIEDIDLVRAVIERQAALLERISEDMRRYAIKHDATRRFLASKEEETAARRAILLIAGRQNVNFAHGHKCRSSANEAGRRVRRPRRDNDGESDA